MDILKDWPSASAYVAQIERQGFKIIEGSYADLLVKEYSAARAALARERMAESAKAFGFAVANVAAELPREAARAAREAYEKLKALVG